uniref:Small cell adhesion glycoprotein n=2 Tax=Sarcophilus harrisii TaxID=9305 RepID=A0A7N4PIF2_SARHA
AGRRREEAGGRREGKWLLAALAPIPIHLCHPRDHVPQLPGLGRRAGTSASLRSNAPLLSEIPGSELGDSPGGPSLSPSAAPGLSLTCAGVKTLICAYTAATMTGFPTLPPPKAEELMMSTPLQQATETLTPTAVANTAVIAGVITVVFITLLSVLIVIIIYLYKNKGSYFTYEPAEGEASATLQMEGDSVQEKKEEYFI